MRRGFELRRVVPSSVVVVVLAVLGTAPSRAQIPDRFTNLKVLPKDISKLELTGIMRGFAGALNVRCNHCHVGEDPDSLDGYDFASDEKETKRTARVMLRMTTEINSSFLPETGREHPVEVRCVTCHRGVKKPQSIDNLVLAAIEEEGLEEAVAQYRDLRSEHYGSSAYDFSPAALDAATEVLAMKKGDFATALAVNELNLEFHPESDYTLYLRARLLLREGDRDGAIAALERAVELNPEVDWLKGQLERLKNPPKDPQD